MERLPGAGPNPTAARPCANFRLESGTDEGAPTAICADLRLASGTDEGAPTAISANFRLESATDEGAPTAICANFHAQYTTGSALADKTLTARKREALTIYSCRQTYPACERPVLISPPEELAAVHKQGIVERDDSIIRDCGFHEARFCVFIVV